MVSTWLCFGAGGRQDTLPLESNSNYSVCSIRRQAAGRPAVLPPLLHPNIPRRIGRGLQERVYAAIQRPDRGINPLLHSNPRALNQPRTGWNRKIIRLIYCQLRENPEAIQPTAFFLHATRSHRLGHSGNLRDL